MSTESNNGSAAEEAEVNAYDPPTEFERFVIECLVLDADARVPDEDVCNQFRKFIDKPSRLADWQRKHLRSTLIRFGAKLEQVITDRFVKGMRLRTDEDGDIPKPAPLEPAQPEEVLVADDGGVWDCNAVDCIGERNIAADQLCPYCSAAKPQVAVKDVKPDFEPEGCLNHKNEYRHYTPEEFNAIAERVSKQYRAFGEMLYKRVSDGFWRKIGRLDVDKVMVVALRDVAGSMCGTCARDVAPVIANLLRAFDEADTNFLGEPAELDVGFAFKVNGRYLMLHVGKTDEGGYKHEWREVKHSDYISRRPAIEMGNEPTDEFIKENWIFYQRNWQEWQHDDADLDYILSMLLAAASDDPDALSGMFLNIVGPSGWGKNTLVRHFGGVFGYDSFANQQPVADDKKEDKFSMAELFEKRIFHLEEAPPPAVRDDADA